VLGKLIQSRILPAKTFSIMKKIVAIGVISGVVLFVYLNSLARQMDGKLRKEKKDGEIAEKNETEGYFYHQS
jgi:hypothetical protein